MYFTDVEGRAMGMKPMNCPAHIQIYNDERHSYSDLPVRYSEAGLVHRHEASGAEDRPAHDRFARPFVAVGNSSARLLDARTLRSQLHRAPTTPSTGP
jgi:hypothetical protein